MAKTRKTVVEQRYPSSLSLRPVLAVLLAWHPRILPAQPAHGKVDAAAQAYGCVQENKKLRQALLDGAGRRKKRCSRHLPGDKRKMDQSD
jgi:hypothetical protein